MISLQNIVLSCLCILAVLQITLGIIFISDKNQNTMNNSPNNFLDSKIKKTAFIIFEMLSAFQNTRVNVLQSWQPRNMIVMMVHRKCLKR